MKNEDIDQKLIKRISLLNAARLAGYIDVRPFKKICEFNNIPILQDNGSSKKYLLLQDLIEFLNRKPLLCLRERTNHAIDLYSGLSVVSKGKQTNKYVQEGQIEKSELSRLSKIINEL